MRIHRGLLAAAVAAALSAGGAAAQMPPVDVELGYRWLDLTGSEDMYRTQVNERQGFLIRGLTLTNGEAKSSWLDNLRLDITELGAGPAGSIRLQAGRAGAYRLRLLYNQMDHFSSLPAFANPLLAQGIVPGQHTADRVRKMFDAELELLPGGVITPIVGYSRNTYTGPGRTTYHVGEDEFQLTQNADDTEQEFRAGLAFSAGPVGGQLIQGWRKFKGTETYGLVPGTGSGNEGSPVLGQNVNLTSYSRTSTVDVTTPVTNALVTAKLGERLKLIGTYVRTKADGDSTDAEALSGSLVSFDLARFYQGLTESIASNAKNTVWRASGRLELTLMDGLDVSAGYARRSRTLDGISLVTDLYLGTTSYVILDKRDLQTILQSQTSVEKTEDVYDVSAAARSLGPLSLRAGWSQIKQDVTLREFPTELDDPVGGQEGSYSRKVNRFDGAASVAVSGVTLGLEYRKEKADSPVFRTDFIERDRYRLRGVWKVVDAFRIWATAEQTDATDDRTGIGFTNKVREWAGGLEFMPAKPLTLRLNVSEYQADSTIPIRLPQTFAVGSSAHKENGDAIEGGLTLNVDPFIVEGAVGRFENTGFLNFKLNRARLRLEVEIAKGYALATEYGWDKYEENPSLFGNYEASRYGLFVRWHP